MVGKGSMTTSMIELFHRRFHLGPCGSGSSAHGPRAPSPRPCPAGPCWLRASSSTPSIQRLTGMPLRFHQLGLPSALIDSELPLQPTVESLLAPDAGPMLPGAGPTGRNSRAACATGRQGPWHPARCRGRGRCWCRRRWCPCCRGQAAARSRRACCCCRWCAGCRPCTRSRCRAGCWPWSARRGAAASPACR